MRPIQVSPRIWRQLVVEPAQVGPVYDVRWHPIDLGTPHFQVAVCAEGILPGPQGSKKHVGRGMMKESSEKVAPWRALVSAAAAEQAREVLDGPLVADMVFSLKAPAKTPVERRGMPSTTPDLSKLLRSTEDALTGIAWTDDGRVIAYRRLAKVYAGSQDPDALPAPGAIIRVWRMPEAPGG